MKPKKIIKCAASSKKCGKPSSEPKEIVARRKLEEKAAKGTRYKGERSNQAEISHRNRPKKADRAGRIGGEIWKCEIFAGNQMKRSAHRCREGALIPHDEEEARICHSKYIALYQSRQRICGRMVATVEVEEEEEIVLKTMLENYSREKAGGKRTNLLSADSSVPSEGCI